MVYKCLECGERVHEDGVREVSDLYERVQPGDIMPVGQCPYCSALINVHDEIKPVLWIASETQEYEIMATHEDDAVRFLSSDRPRHAYVKRTMTRNVWRAEEVSDDV